VRGRAVRWWWPPALLLLFPCSQAAIYFGTGWPVFDLFNTALRATVIWLGGALTVAMATAAVLGLARLAERSRVPEPREWAAAPAGPVRRPGAAVPV